MTLEEIRYWLMDKSKNKPLGERYSFDEVVELISASQSYPRWVKAKYQEWCKLTKRNGAVLVGGSINEFFEWLDESHAVTPSVDVEGLKKLVEWVGEGFEMKATDNYWECFNESYCEKYGYLLDELYPTSHLVETYIHYHNELLNKGGK